MWRELLSWWSQQMTDLLPAGLMRRYDTPANALIVTDRRDAADRPGFALTLRRMRRDAALGWFTLDEAGLRQAGEALAGHNVPHQVILRPQGDCFLEEDIALPLAAEPELDRVLEFEMDRWTPFTAAELYWSWTVQRRDRRLHVRLSMVPRSAVQELTGALQRLNAPVTALQVALPDGTPLLVAIAHRGSKSAGSRPRLAALGLYACGALGAIALALPFVQQSLADGDVEARIAALRPQVSVAETLRQRVSREAAGSDTLATVRARRGEVLRILAYVTDVLPDDTYLIALSLNRQTLRIDGRSAGAARLITALAAGGGIGNPRFAAPVMRTDSGADVFSIQADVGK